MGSNPKPRMICTTVWTPSEHFAGHVAYCNRVYGEGAQRCLDSRCDNSKIVAFDATSCPKCGSPMSTEYKVQKGDSATYEPCCLVPGEYEFEYPMYECWSRLEKGRDGIEFHESTPCVERQAYFAKARIAALTEEVARLRSALQEWYTARESLSGDCLSLGISSHVRDSGKWGSELARRCEPLRKFCYQEKIPLGKEPDQ